MTEIGAIVFDIGLLSLVYRLSAVVLADAAGKRLWPFAVELLADLFVEKTFTCPGISGLMIGNTAEALLNQFTCSVLVKKPPEFQTPVTL